MPGEALVELLERLYVPCPGEHLCFAFLERALDPGDRCPDLQEREQAAVAGDIALDLAQVAARDRRAQLLGLGQVLEIIERFGIEQLAREVAQDDPQCRQIALDLGGRRACQKGVIVRASMGVVAGLAPALRSMVRVAPLRVRRT